MDDETSPLAGSGHRKDESAIVAFRPRVLYCAIVSQINLRVLQMLSTIVEILSSSLAVRVEHIDSGKVHCPVIATFIAEIHRRRGGHDICFTICNCGLLSGMGRVVGRCTRTVVFLVGPREIEGHRIWPRAGHCCLPGTWIARLHGQGLPRQQQHDDPLVAHFDESYLRGWHGHFDAIVGWALPGTFGLHRGRILR